MIFEPTPVAGSFLVRLERREDARGFFARSWCEDEFAAHGLATSFPQQSLARSLRAGTLRGMHLQVAPHAEDKYVRCTRGRIFDAIHDLRPASPSFGRSFWAVLDADGGDALYVPRGCAHGYQTLEDGCDVLYAMSSRYAPQAARSIRWNDPALGIAWPLADPLVSDTDRAAPALADYLAAHALTESP